MDTLFLGIFFGIELLVMIYAISLFRLMKAQKKRMDWILVNLLRFKGTE